MFVLDGEVMSNAFYWSSWSTDHDVPETIDESQFQSVLHQAIQRVKHLARFFVVDFAEFPDGSWEAIELNDGNMSGLSDTDPHELWTNVYDHMTSIGS